MTCVRKIIFSVIVLVLFLCPSQVIAQNEILNIRHWAAPDHTRVVIDVSDDTPYTIEKADKKLFIDFKDTDVSEDFPDELILKKPGIDKIMVIPLPEGCVRVELSIAENVETKVFNIKKIQDKPDRVVIDIEFPDVKKQESKEREEVKVLRKKKIIVIDPGHGGEDPGAVGKLRTQEKRVVLEISRKLRDILNKKEGYRAFLTRNGDYYVPFKKRLKIAREYGADLFLSIHADSFKNRSARGSSVYCLSLRGASSEAAKFLARNENLADIIGGSPNGENSDETDPIILNMFQTNTINSSKVFGSTVLKYLDGVNGVKYDRVHEAPFMVLKLPEIPSLLIETAYISNPKEEKLLGSSRFQKEIAKAIAAAVTEFLPVQPVMPSKIPKIVLTKNGEKPPILGTSDDTDKSKKRSTVYTVKRGDTLEWIAKKHNTKISTLLKLNRMQVDDTLYFGRVLKVPVPENDISEVKRHEEIKASPAGVESSPSSPVLVVSGYKEEKDEEVKSTTVGVESTSSSPAPLYKEKKDEEVKILNAREGPPSTKPEPAVTVYKAKRGDSLDKIARRHNTTISMLLKLNNMKMKEPLYIGRKLKIPVLEKAITEEKKDGKFAASTGGTESVSAKPEAVARVYKVKRGDSLDMIARKHNTTIGVLLKLNNMKMKEPLYVGRKLKMPDAEVGEKEVKKSVIVKSTTNTYSVKKGDTLDKIAKKCNTSISELRKLNQIKRADVLYVNQKLKIPSNPSL
jgi:N-acetylmuramoyl-L-alanine amidase